jgi:DNA-binding response OmpR family regulator
MTTSDPCASALAEVERLRAEVSRLQDRVEQLEEVLGTGDDDLELIRRAVPALTTSERKLLGAIHKRRGRVATKDILFEALYGDRPECDQPHAKTVEVLMSKLRGKVAPLGIVIRTEYGSGYFMDAFDRLRLAGLLDDTQEAAA